jgi:multicomponent Na+:H+ antiporter subunit E
MVTKLATFVTLSLFWVVLSGMFDAFHLTLGLISSMLVTLTSHHLLFYGGKKRSWLMGTLNVARYLPWLLWQIIIANLQVTAIILHPRILQRIDPCLIRFRSRLARPIARVTLAQSITLTPGTITVDLHDDQFTVYALTRAAADSLPGEMERRVGLALDGAL